MISAVVSVKVRWSVKGSCIHLEPGQEVECGEGEEETVEVEGEELQSAAEAAWIAVGEDGGAANQAGLPIICGVVLSSVVLLLLVHL